MGCTRHVISDPNCMACQVKSISTEQRGATREARRANDLQAQANAQAAAHQAAAAEEAHWARVAAEQQSANTAAFQQSMWSQSADGRAWSAWAAKAEGWVANASGHDEVLLPYWKEAAAPGWQTGEIAQRKNRADTRVTLALLALGVGIVGSVIGIILYAIVGGGHSGIGAVIGVLTDICNWLVPISIVALVIAWIAGAGKRGPLEARVAASPQVQQFVARFGANPFTKPQELPSWRPGLTCAQTQQANDYVLSLARPTSGFYPRPDQLPDLPELVVRDLAEFPPEVADAARAHFSPE